ncbi:hypothetical protein [Pseudokineococcus lusitanus]|uniref:DUF5666 domain-containing protein n=1 Tax=Pseudokineococcus lusitanus TaxID=763993 RepID=A0A3N1HKH5_9ACTN|nr:hypothetical protein [Pseudokineococcus lusitanus]ROP42965.1 hypothetical protein EDC03_2256 [Pseudokineococcus lusitanus]
MRTTPRTPAALAVVAVLAALGAGCGAPAPAPAAPSVTTSAPSPTTDAPGTQDGDVATDQPPTDPTTPPPTTPPPSRGASPSLPLLPRPTAPPTAPTDVPRPTRYEGAVVEPSAPGCVEMEVGGQRFTLLLPEGTEVAVGDRLVVRGTPRPTERATGCAGTQVAVDEVRTA